MRSKKWTTGNCEKWWSDGEEEEEMVRSGEVKVKNVLCASNSDKVCETKVKTVNMHE